jgi:hypothetical protein
MMSKKNAHKASGRKSMSQSFESVLADTIVPVPIRSQFSTIAGSDGNNGMVGGFDQLRVNPSAFTNRFKLIAACFNQYRVRHWKIRYYPVTTSSGVEDTNGTAETTPVYNSTTFAFGANTRDPEEPLNSSSASFGDLVAGGARMFHTDRPFTYTVDTKSPRWLYCYVDDNTAASHRQNDFGQMFGISPSTQTDNNTFGFLVHDFIVEFRGPSSGQSGIGVSTSPTRPAGIQIEEKTSVVDIEDWEVASAIALSMGKTQPVKPNNKPAAKGTKHKHIAIAYDP